MSDPTPNPAPADVPTPPATQEQAPQPATPAAQPEAQHIEDLPEWAQRVIRETRSEAAGNRTKATAAEKAQQETLDKIAVALGIKQGDTTPQPEELTAELTAARGAQRQAAIELAVYRTAAKHAGDPDALLDSRAFLTTINGLDPAAQDFTTAVDAAVKDAVAANAKLRLAPAAPITPPPPADPPGGFGASRPSGWPALGQGRSETAPTPATKPGMGTLRQAYTPTQ